MTAVSGIGRAQFNTQARSRNPEAVVGAVALQSQPIPLFNPLCAVYVVAGAATHVADVHLALGK